MSTNPEGIKQQLFANIGQDVRVMLLDPVFYLSVQSKLGFDDGEYFVHSLDSITGNESIVRFKASQVREIARNPASDELRIYL